MTGELWVCHLGTVDYRSTVDLQERIRAARRSDRIPDVLLLLEHHPVYTRGRRSAPGELPLGAAWYAARGIEIVDTNRGGKITYHGPGQLVGYPIVAVTDVVAYVRTLEQALVSALADEGLTAHAREQDGPAFTGVWLQDRKIASIGVHVAQSITTHGFAVNVINDLRPFGWVVACGLPDVEMTSIRAEHARLREQAASGEAASAEEVGSAAAPQHSTSAQGSDPTPCGLGAIPRSDPSWSEEERELMRSFRQSVQRHLAAAFQRRPVAVTLDQLEERIAAEGASTIASSSLPSRPGSLVS
ncbi:MAG: lipoyl(octanoyl) transferase LipB [Solirubrobacteraceae bacterium]